MLTTYQVPVGLLAAQTLQPLGGVLARRLRQGRPASWAGRAPTVLATGVLAVVLLTNVYLTAWRVLDLHRARYPYYLTDGDVGALTTLDEVTAPGDVVLSSPELGIFVPVYSDARPFVAHWAQTLDFFARRDAAARVFAPTTPDSERRAILTANRVAFVLAGPAEVALGGAREAVPLPLERVRGGALGSTVGTAIYRTDLAPLAGAQP
jgi:hypothetical protein